MSGKSSISGFEENPDKLTMGQVNPAFVRADDDSLSIEGMKKSGQPAERQMTYGPKENRWMLKNVVVISIAFMFLFTAFQSMAVLQSSINSGKESPGLGNWSLSAVYAGLIISSFFLPTVLIRQFTVKWALFGSVFGYVLYIGAQFHARYYTLIPAGLITGMCAAPLWSAKCTYLTKVGHEYANLVGDNAEVIVVRFFGIFFFFFQSASVWGNLISSLVLSSDGVEEPLPSSSCGPNYCPWVDLGNSTTRDNATTVYTLAGIYVGCALAAAGIIALFVAPLSRYGETRREGSVTYLLSATARHMKHPYQILLIPLTIWSGLEQGFFGSDFTAGYITCSWGVSHVGYVLICYGICDAISSISFGPVIRYIGRMPVFILGAVINISVMIGLLIWEPNSDQSIVYFVVAGLWGIADGIWQCEINAFYGVLFHKNEEAAFSNYRLWESLGFIIAYINSNYICVDAKLYLLLAVIVIGMLGYFAIEFKERRKTH